MIKNIIQRALPLDVQYTVIDKKYIPIEQSCGAYCCDNCGALIANIATVVNADKKQFNIGFDCLETVLINNNLLDGKSILEYEAFKKQIPTIIKKAKEISETIKDANKRNVSKVVSIQFDKTDFESWRKYGKSSFLTFYYIFDTGRKENSNIRVKNDFNLNAFFETFETISKIKPILN